MSINSFFKNEKIKVQFLNCFGPYKYCRACGVANRFCNTQCWKCSGSMKDFTFYKGPFPADTKSIASQKICPACKEQNNPSFVQCWKCKSDLLGAPIVKGLVADVSSLQLTKQLILGFFIILGFCIVRKLVPFNPFIFGTLWFISMGICLNALNNWSSSPVREFIFSLRMLGLVILYLVFLLFCLAGAGQLFFLLGQLK